MNEGKTFFDLPQAQTVPAGSRYAVEMGDGSGTKSVTHEDVVKAVAGIFRWAIQKTLKP